MRDSIKWHRSNVSNYIRGLKLILSFFIFFSLPNFSFSSEMSRAQFLRELERQNNLRSFYLFQSKPNSGQLDESEQPYENVWNQPGNFNLAKNFSISLLNSTEYRPQIKPGRQNAESIDIAWFQANALARLDSLRNNDREFNIDVHRALSTQFSNILWAKALGVADFESFDEDAIKEKLNQLFDLQAANRSSIESENIAQAKKHILFQIFPEGEALLRTIFASLELAETKDNQEEVERAQAQLTHFRGAVESKLIEQLVRSGRSLLDVEHDYTSVQQHNLSTLIRANPHVLGGLGESVTRRPIGESLQRTVGEQNDANANSAGSPEDSSENSIQTNNVGEQGESHQVEVEIPTPQFNGFKGHGEAYSDFHQLSQAISGQSPPPLLGPTGQPYGLREVRQDPRAMTRSQSTIHCHGGHCPLQLEPSAAPSFLEDLDNRNFTGHTAAYAGGTAACKPDPIKGNLSVYQDCLIDVFLNAFHAQPPTNQSNEEFHRLVTGNLDSCKEATFGTNIDPEMEAKIAEVRQNSLERLFVENEEQVGMRILFGKDLDNFDLNFDRFFNVQRKLDGEMDHFTDPEIRNARLQEIQTLIEEACEEAPCVSLVDEIDEKASHDLVHEATGESMRPPTIYELDITRLNFLNPEAKFWKNPDYQTLLNEYYGPAEIQQRLSTFRFPEEKRNAIRSCFLNQLGTLVSDPAYQPFRYAEISQACFGHMKGVILSRVEMEDLQFALENKEITEQEFALKMADHNRGYGTMMQIMHDMYRALENEVRQKVQGGQGLSTAEIRIMELALKLRLDIKREPHSVEDLRQRLGKQFREWGHSGFALRSRLSPTVTGQEFFYRRLGSPLEMDPKDASEMISNQIFNHGENPESRVEQAYMHQLYPQRMRLIRNPRLSRPINSYFELNPNFASSRYHTTGPFGGLDLGFDNGYESESHLPFTRHEPPNPLDVLGLRPPPRPEPSFIMQVKPPITPYDRVSIPYEIKAKLDGHVDEDLRMCILMEAKTLMDDIRALNAMAVQNKKPLQMSELAELWTSRKKRCVEILTKSSEYFSLTEEEQGWADYYGDQIQQQVLNVMFDHVHRKSLIGLNPSFEDEALYLLRAAVSSVDEGNTMPFLPFNEYWRHTAGRGNALRDSLGGRVLEEVRESIYEFDPSQYFDSNSRFWNEHDSNSQNLYLSNTVVVRRSDDAPAVDPRHFSGPYAFSPEIKEGREESGDALPYVFSHGQYSAMNLDDLDTLLDGRIDEQRQLNAAMKKQFDEFDFGYGSAHFFGAGGTDAVGDLDPDEHHTTEDVVFERMRMRGAQIADDNTRLGQSSFGLFRPGRVVDDLRNSNQSSPMLEAVLEGFQFTPGDPRVRSYEAGIRQLDHDREFLYEKGREIADKVAEETCAFWRDLILSAPLTFVGLGVATGVAKTAFSVLRFAKTARAAHQIANSARTAGKLTRFGKWLATPVRSLVKTRRFRRLTAGTRRAFNSAMRRKESFGEAVSSGVNVTVRSTPTIMLMNQGIVQALGQISAGTRYVRETVIGGGNKSYVDFVSEEAYSALRESVRPSAVGQMVLMVGAAGGLARGLQRSYVSAGNTPWGPWNGSVWNPTKWGQRTPFAKRFAHIQDDVQRRAAIETAAAVPANVISGVAVGVPFGMHGFNMWTTQMGALEEENIKLQEKLDQGGMSATQIAETEEQILHNEGMIAAASVRRWAEIVQDVLMTTMLAKADTRVLGMGHGPQGYKNQVMGALRTALQSDKPFRLENVEMTPAQFREFKAILDEIDAFQIKYGDTTYSPLSFGVSFDRGTITVTRNPQSILSVLAEGTPIPKKAFTQSDIELYSQQMGEMTRVLEQNVLPFFESRNSPYQLPQPAAPPGSLAPPVPGGPQIPGPYYPPNTNPN